MTIVYTLSKTAKSRPVAYFNTYKQANEYNQKYYNGKYIVSDEIVFNAAIN